MTSRLKTSLRLVEDTGADNDAGMARILVTETIADGGLDRLRTKFKAGEYSTKHAVFRFYPIVLGEIFSGEVEEKLRKSGERRG